MQTSARDHTGAQTKIYPWDLALTLVWGGEQGFPEQDWLPSRDRLVPGTAQLGCLLLLQGDAGLEDSVGSCGQVMATIQTASWSSCRAESSAKGIHSFYNNVTGLTRFGEVRILAPYPAPCECACPTSSLQKNSWACAPLMPFPQPVTAESGAGNEPLGHDGRFVPCLRHCGSESLGSVTGTCDLLPLGCPRCVQECQECS